MMMLLLCCCWWWWSPVQYHCQCSLVKAYAGFVIKAWIPPFGWPYVWIQHEIEECGRTCYLLDSGVPTCQQSPRPLDRWSIKLDNRKTIWSDSGRTSFRSDSVWGVIQCHQVLQFFGLQWGPLYQASTLAPSCGLRGNSYCQACWCQPQVGPRWEMRPFKMDWKSKSS